MYDEWDTVEDQQPLGPPGGWDPLPDGLTEQAPGPELASMLASVDRSRLCGFDRVVVLQARARLLAHAQAEFYADMVAVAEAVVEEVGPDGSEYRADEIRAALRWTRRAAESQLGWAWQLVVGHPQVAEALRDGGIDLPRARVIVSGICYLDPDVAQRLANEILVQASELTTGQLRALLQRLGIQADPDGARKRYERGVEARRVVVGAGDDGTANLYGLSLAPDRAQAAWDRIGSLAQHLKGRHDPRTMDQVRADVLLDLLEGRGLPQGRRGVVDLQIDLTTLAGLSENPAAIPGWGPLIADVARAVALEQQRAQWRITVTEEGEVIWAGTTRRRPTGALRRRVEATHPTCVFPGCRMPARGCDLDHRRPWSHGGPTAEHNLTPECRHDHGTRHRGGWKLRRLRPGIYQWTSPLGHNYTVRARGP